MDAMLATLDGAPLAAALPAVETCRSAEPSGRRLSPQFWEERHAMLRERLGARVRTLRLERQMTLRALAASIGVSIQQLLKYESGANTLSASRLYMTARALQVPIEALTDGIDPAAATAPVRPASASGQVMAPDFELAVTRLIAAVGQPNPRVRSALADLIKAIRVA